MVCLGQGDVRGEIPPATQATVRVYVYNALTGQCLEGNHVNILCRLPAMHFKSSYYRVLTLRLYHRHNYVQTVLLASLVFEPVCVYTGLMHWFTSPYVHRLTHNRKTGLTEAETLNILAKYQRRTFSESEVEFPKSFRPQSTFQVGS